MVASSRPGNRTQLTPTTRAGITRGLVSPYQQSQGPARQHRATSQRPAAHPLPHAPIRRKRWPDHAKHPRNRTLLRRRQIGHGDANHAPANSPVKDDNPRVAHQAVPGPRRIENQMQAAANSKARRHFKGHKPAQLLNNAHNDHLSHSQVPSPHRGDRGSAPTIRRARRRCENRTHPRAPAANGIRAAHQSRPSPITTRAPIKSAGNSRPALTTV